MASLGNLKNAEEPYSRISISHDMTKEEREQNKKLLTEAKKLQDEDQGNWTYKVRGPPWDLKIVKLSTK